MLKKITVDATIPDQGVFRFCCWAEDFEHAIEQARDFHKEATRLRIVGMTPNPEPGDKVWWDDPDGGFSSVRWILVRSS